MRKPTAYSGLLVTTYLPSEVRLLGCWWWGGWGDPGGATVGRNCLLPTLQYSPPFQPGDCSLCHGHNSSSQSVYVGYCAASGQDRAVSYIFKAALYSHGHFDSDYW